MPDEGIVKTRFGAFANVVGGPLLFGSLFEAPPQPATAGAKTSRRASAAGRLRTAQRQRERQVPLRPSARPTSLFFALRVIRFGLPEATACTSPRRRAER